jgi:hypothetical protein
MKRWLLILCAASLAACTSEVGENTDDRASAEIGSTAQALDNGRGAPAGLNAVLDTRGAGSIRPDPGFIDPRTLVSGNPDPFPADPAPHSNTAGTPSNGTSR